MHHAPTDATPTGLINLKVLKLAHNEVQPYLVQHNAGDSIASLLYHPSCGPASRVYRTNVLVEHAKTAMTDPQNVQSCADANHSFESFRAFSIQSRDSEIV